MRSTSKVITKTKGIFILPVMVLATLAAAGGTLSSKSPCRPVTMLPSQRYNYSAAIVADKLYVIGGASAPLHQVRTVEEYDLVTGRWTEKAPMTVARHCFRAIAHRGLIYAVGGDAEGRIEVFDPARNMWRVLTSMPVARNEIGAELVEDKIYVLGGIPPGGDGKVVYRDVDAYDLAAGEWTRKSPIPQARFAFGTAALSGKIYLIGGLISGRASDAVEEFSPSSDTWEVRPAAPLKNFCYSTVSGSRVLAIGDYSMDGAQMIAAFDPQAVRWAAIEKELGFAYPMAVFAYGSKLYLLGPRDSAAFIRDRHGLYVYDLSEGEGDR